MNIGGNIDFSPTPNLFLIKTSGDWRNCALENYAVHVNLISIFHNVLFIQPIDSRRDEYRKYLERNGVMETLTKVLCKLMLQYENDNKDDAIDFIRKNLGDAVYENDVIASLRTQLEESRKEIEDLKRQIRELKESGVAAPVEEVAPSVAEEPVASPREEPAASPREEPVTSPREEPVASPRQETVSSPRQEQAPVESVEEGKTDEAMAENVTEQKKDEPAEKPTAEETEPVKSDSVEASAESAKDETPASPAEAPKDAPAPSAEETASSKEPAEAEKA